MVKFFLSLALLLLSMQGISSAQCSGRVTPVRSVISARPIQSTLRKIQASTQSNRAARAASCSGERATGCSGPQAVPQAAAPTATPLCENGRCDVVRNIIAAPARLVSGAYQQALASAQYRAANRIHGHSSLDTHCTSGVGWSTNDPQPNTCLGRGGDNYAVAKGNDGWYASKLIP